MGNGNSSQFGAKTTAYEVAKDLDLTGRVCIVTGANSGIGKETARVLAVRGATVILACRTLKTAEAARDEIIASVRQPTPPETAVVTEEPVESRVRLFSLDLGSFKSIEEFCVQFQEQQLPLHILINNAGIYSLKNFETTEDGFEKQWGTNHLGHFMLTMRLMPQLKAAAPSRVVFVASRAHSEIGFQWDFNVSQIPPPAHLYDSWRAYGCSKLCNILTAKELNKRFQNYGVTAYSLHPGVIATDIARNDASAQAILSISKAFLKTIPEGAATTMVCAVQDKVNCGAYYLDCQEETPSDDALNPSYARLLWEISSLLIQSPLDRNSTFQHDSEAPLIILPPPFVEDENAPGFSPVSSSSPSQDPSQLEFDRFLEDKSAPAPAKDAIVSSAVNVGKENWIADESSPLCQLCKAQFGVIKRRHHCRYCGKVVCAKCSSNEMPPGQQNVAKVSAGYHFNRTCDECFVTNSETYRFYIFRATQKTWPHLRQSQSSSSSSSAPPPSPYSYSSLSLHSSSSDQLFI